MNELIKTAFPRRFCSRHSTATAIRHLSLPELPYRHSRAPLEDTTPKGKALARFLSIGDSGTSTVMTPGHQAMRRRFTYLMICRYQPSPARAIIFDFWRYARRCFSPPPKWADGGDFQEARHTARRARSTKRRAAACWHEPGRRRRRNYF